MGARIDAFETWIYHWNCVLTIAATVVIFFLIRFRNPRLRIYLRKLVVFIGVVATGFFALDHAFDIGQTTYSDPIPSPDGQWNARVRTSDTGATGGSQAVTLRRPSAREQSQVYVYTGKWDSVQPRDVRWISNGELQITFTRELEHPCESIPEVKVTCISAVSDANPDPR